MINTSQPDNNPVNANTILEQEARQWGMFVHFAQYGGFIAPVVGLILPIIFWQIKKDRFPIVDVHGKIVVNWILSLLIYSIICAILSFIFIGLLGFSALLIMSLLYPIIGGIKANNGEVWQYPLSIRFFEIKDHALYG